MVLMCRALIGMSRKQAAYITQAALNKASVEVGGCKQSLPESTRSEQHQTWNAE